ncbi:MAG: hypothetical protein Marn2KO_29720 [Marinobacter nauticus]
MGFKINRRDVSLIVSILSNSDLESVFKNAEEAMLSGDSLKVRYIGNLSQGQVNEVIDSLSDYLVRNGVNEFGELNSLGYRLESVIGIFSVE